MTSIIAQKITENMDADIKIITIPLSKLASYGSNNAKKTKKQEKEQKEQKERITKIGSRSWNLLPNQKTTEFQHGLLTQLCKNTAVTASSDTVTASITSSEADKYFCQEMMKLLKIKRSSYKSQDVLKNKYNINTFVSIPQIIQLLYESNLICLYCGSAVSVLYEYVYEPKQWTLDRVDNTLGHNAGNVVIACLECNLKRRLTNKTKFQFGKKIILTKCIREDDDV